MNNYAPSGRVGTCSRRDLYLLRVGPSISVGSLRLEIANPPTVPLTLRGRQAGSDPQEICALGSVARFGCTLLWDYWL